MGPNKILVTTEGSPLNELKHCRFSPANTRLSPAHSRLTPSNATRQSPRASFTPTVRTPGGSAFGSEMRVEDISSSPVAGAIASVVTAHTKVRGQECWNTTGRVNGA